MEATKKMGGGAPAAAVAFILLGLAGNRLVAAAIGHGPIAAILGAVIGVAAATGAFVWYRRLESTPQKAMLWLAIVLGACLLALVAAAMGNGRIGGVASSEECIRAYAPDAEDRTLAAIAIRRCDAAFRPGQHPVLRARYLCEAEAVASVKTVTAFKRIVPADCKAKHPDPSCPANHWFDYERNSCIELDPFRDFPPVPAAQ